MIDPMRSSPHFNVEACDGENQNTARRYSHKENNHEDIKVLLEVPSIETENLK